MAKATTVKEAIKKFEEVNHIDATEAEHVRSHFGSLLEISRSSCGGKFRLLRKWMRRFQALRIACMNSLSESE